LLPGGGYASAYATRVDKVEKKQEGGKQDGRGKPDKSDTTKIQSDGSSSDSTVLIGRR
jgi:hypothetical protein